MLLLLLLPCYYICSFIIITTTLQISPVIIRLNFILRAFKYLLALE